MIILIKESLPNLVETKDLATVTQLEACLAGQYVTANNNLRRIHPGGATTPLRRLEEPLRQADEDAAGAGRLRPRHVSQPRRGRGQHRDQRDAQGRHHVGKTAEYRRLQAGHRQGPEPSKRHSGDANAAGQLEYQQQLQTLERLALNSGITSLPSIDSPQFIPQVVFDQTRGVNQPKARFAYLFPTKNSALIQVRLKASLSDAQQARAISLIRQAIRMPMFRSNYGATDTVTGVPVVVNDLASEITGSIAGLLIAALLVMAATLLIVFRSGCGCCRWPSRWPRRGSPSACWRSWEPR